MTPKGNLQTGFVGAEKSDANKDKEKSLYNLSQDKRKDDSNYSLDQDSRVLEEILRQNDWNYQNDHNQFGAGFTDDLDSWLNADLNASFYSFNQTVYPPAPAPAPEANSFRNENENNPLSVQPIPIAPAPAIAGREMELFPNPNPIFSSNGLLDLDNANMTLVNSNPKYTTVSSTSTGPDQKSTTRKQKRPKKQAGPVDEEERVNNGSDSDSKSNNPRKRNTLASQKFRQKKKERDAALMNQVEEQNVVIQELRDEIGKLKAINSFLVESLRKS